MSIQDKVEVVMAKTGCDKLTAILTLMQTSHQVEAACHVILMRAV